MTEFTILDDVFVGKVKHSKKISASQILGIQDAPQTGHKRYKSKEFLPFTSQRDIKGRIIKGGQSQLQKPKSVTLLSSVLNNQDQHNSQNNKTSNLNKKSLIEDRFKVHSINHFKEINTQSHLHKINQFKIQLSNLENKNYEKKLKLNQIEEWNLFKMLQKSLKIKKEDQNCMITGFNSKQKPIQKCQSSISFNKTYKRRSLDSIQEINQKKQGNKKSKTQQSGSYKSLLTQKSNRNPQLQQIQRHAKVHFNHAQLDRLKQSRRLTFKFLQDISSGDKKFKQKTQEYRNIKQRVKKQMGKM